MVSMSHQLIGSRRMSATQKWPLQCTLHRSTFFGFWGTLLNRSAQWSLLFRSSLMCIIILPIMINTLEMDLIYISEWLISPICKEFSLTGLLLRNLETLFIRWHFLSSRKLIKEWPIWIRSNKQIVVCSTEY